MAPDPKPDIRSHKADSMLHRLLGGMSVFTMAMTLPQVWSVWVDRQAAGVSLWSWSAYLLSAVLWFWHGLRQGDKNIYIPCIGWVVLDLGVITGVLFGGR